MDASTHTCSTCGQDTTAIEAAKVAAAAANREAYPLVWFINVKMECSGRANYRVGYFSSKEKAQEAAGGRTEAKSYPGDKSARRFEFFAMTSAELSDLDMEKLDQDTRYGYP